MRGVSTKGSLTLRFFVKWSPGPCLTNNLTTNRYRIPYLVAFSYVYDLS